MLWAHYRTLFIYMNIQEVETIINEALIGADARIKEIDGPPE